MKLPNLFKRKPKRISISDMKDIDLNIFQNHIPKSDKPIHELINTEIANRMLKTSHWIENGKRDGQKD